MTKIDLKYYLFIVLFWGYFSSVESGFFRIIDGRTASSFEFPYQADIERGFKHWCGGSIITPKFVLTAAHCIYFVKVSPVPRSLIQVRVAHEIVASGGIVHEVDSVIFHDDFSNDAEMDQYDIGLVKVIEPFVYSEQVQPVKLVDKEPEEGEMAWVTGFGKQIQMRSVENTFRTFKAVEIPIISLEECRKLLNNVADDMICAGTKNEHKDACTGDSGGPLVVEKGQAGIVAWGLGCGRKGLPGVYTNVAYYREWINERINVTEPTEIEPTEVTES